MANDIYVPGRAVDLCQRLAVLLPLENARRAADGAPFLRPQTLTNERVLQLVSELVQRWKQRAADLDASGWTYLRGETLRYVQRCIPTVAVLPASRSWRHPCHTLPCPWCWARRVKDVFELVIRHAPAHEPRRCRTYGGDACKIVSCSWAAYVPQAGDRAGRVQQVSELLSWAGDLRGRAVDGCQAKGAVAISTVEPAKGGPEWIVRNRLIMLVDEFWERPPNLDVAGMLWQIAAKLTKKNIAYVVGNALWYPAGWMFGQPERMVEVIEGRTNRRLQSTFGVFHGRSAAVSDSAGRDERIDTLLASLLQDKADRGCYEQSR